MRDAAGVPVRELELKSVVDDWPLRRKCVEEAGGTLEFEGRLLDRRYDRADRSLVAQDQVLRLRVYETDDERTAHLDWKGPTELHSAYKAREELSTSAGNPGVLAAILGRLGFVVVYEIDREIAQYQLRGCVVRFERYPRMDDLVEVEGDPDAIEQAIESIGLPRAGFTAERLRDFTARFEQRTGVRAAVCRREALGEYPYERENV